MKREDYVLVFKMREMTVGEQTKMVIECRNIVNRISEGSRCVLGIGERKEKRK